MGLREESEINTGWVESLRSTGTLFNGDSCALMEVRGKEKQATCYTAGLGRDWWRGVVRIVARRSQDTGDEQAAGARRSPERVAG